MSYTYKRTPAQRRAFLVIGELQEQDGYATWVTLKERRVQATVVHDLVHLGYVEARFHPTQNTPPELRLTQLGSEALVSILGVDDDGVDGLKLGS